MERMYLIFGRDSKEKISILVSIGKNTSSVECKTLLYATVVIPEWKMR